MSWGGHRVGARRLLLALLLLSLVVRVGVVLVSQDYVPENDAADYHRHALSIAAGNGYPESLLVDGGPSAARTPAYPYFLGAVYAVTGDSVTAGRLANAVLGVLIVLLVYLVANRLWGERVALVSAAIAAIFPPFVFLASSLLSDALGLVFAMLALLALLNYQSSGGRVRDAVLAGAAGGMVALTRGNGLLIVLLVVAAVLLSSRRPVRRALTATAASVLAAVLVIVPWTIRNAAEFDRFVLVSTHSAALAGTYNERARTSEEHTGAYHPISALPELDDVFSRPDLNEAEAEAILRRRAVDYARDHPGYVLEASALNTLRLFEVIPQRDRFAVGQAMERGLGNGVKADMMRPSALILGALALAGLVLLLTRSVRPIPPWFVWLTPLVVVLATVPVDGRPRYRLFVDPFLIMLAALALVWLRDRVTNRLEPA